MLMEFALKKFCVHTFVPQCAGGLPPRLPYNFIPAPSQYFHLSFFCSIGSWWPVLARFRFIVQMVIQLVLPFLYPDALETMSWYRTSRLYLQSLCHRGLLSLLILWGTCWSRCRNQNLYAGDIKNLRGQWLLFPDRAAELDKQMKYGSAQLKMSWRGLSQEVLVSGCNFMSWVMALKILDGKTENLLTEATIHMPMLWPGRSLLLDHISKILALFPWLLCCVVSSNLITGIVMKLCSWQDWTLYCSVTVQRPQTVN